MKVLYTCSVALFFSALSFAQSGSPKPLISPVAGKVLVAAHRGDWRNAPENSLRAFTNAADMGVDMVEVDLKMSKDSVLVIMHDATINRTTDGKGKPKDFTFAELQKFRLKNGLGRLTNHRIPTLREVMLALKGKPIMVNLDKSYDYFTEAFALLKETGTLQQAIFKSDVPFAALQQKFPLLIDSIIYMPVVSLDSPIAKEQIDTYLSHMRPYAFELIFKKDTSAVLTNFRFIYKRGSAIWINSLWASLNGGHDDDMAVDDGNTTDSWDWLIAHGAAILQTDRPKELLEYLRAKKLHP